MVCEFVFLIETLFRNEFLAVRNPEGTFYLCQAAHNVYKPASKIRIRWLNEGPPNADGDRTYTFDFFDVTDFECVLTTVDLDKIDAKNYELSKEEQTRIESILKKAIDVEKGIVPRPTVTEENPDGREFIFIVTKKAKNLDLIFCSGSIIVQGRGPVGQITS